MKIEDIKLTADQERWWEHTRTAFIWQAPGWVHIMVSMLNPRQDDQVLYWSENVEQMDSDGRIIVANPKWFFSLKLKVRVAALAHIVCHATLSHYVQQWRLQEIGHVVIDNKTTIPYVKEIADIATDFVVNANLKQGNIGEIPEDWFCDDSIANYESSWREAYKKVYDLVQGMASRLDITFVGKKRIDDHSEPGKSENKPPEQAAQERDQQEIRWQNALAQAAAITKETQGMGQGTEGQLKFFEKLMEPRVSWTDEITAEFSRMPGSGSYDWLRADEELLMRGIFAPARSGFGCNTVVVIMDSSGSIYGVEGLIDRFFGELTGILTDVKPKRIFVIWCDASVRATYEIYDEMDLAACYHEGAKGGGGTSFVPPFEWLKKQEIDDIDMAVYLTDGDGAFPSKPPPFPLIWGDISGYTGKYPKWARVVKIPNDGTA